MPDGAVSAAWFFVGVDLALCPFEASSVIRGSVCMVSSWVCLCARARSGLPESAGNLTRCDSGGLFDCTLTRRGPSPRECQPGRHLPSSTHGPATPANVCYELTPTRID